MLGTYASLMLRIGALLLFLFFKPGLVFGQERIVNDDEFGITGGVHVSFGTHVQRAGVFLAGYCIFNHLQLNANFRLAFAGRHLGPRLGSVECIQSVGVVYGFENGADHYNFFPHSVSNQMDWKYAVGYAYNFYWDRWKTSQRTGTIGFSVDKMELIHENDALGARTDRYRTAALMVSYRYLDNRYAVNTTLWTGNANDPAVRKVDSVAFARFGYKDLSDARYGKISHGLLSAQWDHAFDYGQQLRVNFGVDSEQVRNFIQNKLMHDMYLWPRKWNTARNPHIPMLDAEGQPFVYWEGQVLRQDRLLLQVGLNDLSFY
ncbi:MAG: polymorphic toxin type 23 domain-containing protein [Cyclobacteriaceae bacterium]